MAFQTTKAQLALPGHLKYLPSPARCSVSITASSFRPGVSAEARGPPARAVRCHLAYVLRFHLYSALPLGRGQGRLLELEKTI